MEETIAISDAQFRPGLQPEMMEFEVGDLSRKQILNTGSYDSGPDMKKRKFEQYECDEVPTSRTSCPMTAQDLKQISFKRGVVPTDMVPEENHYDQLDINIHGLKTSDKLRNVDLSELARFLAEKDEKTRSSPQEITAFDSSLMRNVQPARQTDASPPESKVTQMQMSLEPEIMEGPHEAECTKALCLFSGNVLEDRSLVTRPVKKKQRGKCSQKEKTETVPYKERPKTTATTKTGKTTRAKNSSSVKINQACSESVRNALAQRKTSRVRNLTKSPSFSPAAESPISLPEQLSRVSGVDLESSTDNLDYMTFTKSGQSAVDSAYSDDHYLMEEKGQGEGFSQLKSVGMKTQSMVSPAVYKAQWMQETVGVDKAYPLCFGVSIKKGFDIELQNRNPFELSMESSRNSTHGKSAQDINSFDLFYENFVLSKKSPLPQSLADAKFAGMVQPSSVPVKSHWKKEDSFNPGPFQRQTKHLQLGFDDGKYPVQSFERKSSVVDHLKNGNLHGLGNKEVFKMNSFSQALETPYIPHSPSVQHSNEQGPQTLQATPEVATNVDIDDFIHMLSAGGPDTPESPQSTVVTEEEGPPTVAPSAVVTLDNTQHCGQSLKTPTQIAQTEWENAWVKNMGQIFGNSATSSVNEISDTAGSTVNFPQIQIKGPQTETAAREQSRFHVHPFEFSDSKPDPQTSTSAHGEISTLNPAPKTRVEADLFDDLNPSFWNSADLEENYQNWSNDASCLWSDLTCQSVTTRKPLGGTRPSYRETAQPYLQLLTQETNVLDNAGDLQWECLPQLGADSFRTGHNDAGLSTMLTEDTVFTTNPPDLEAVIHDPCGLDQDALGELSTLLMENLVHYTSEIKNLDRNIQYH